MSPQERVKKRKMKDRAEDKAFHREGKKKKKDRYLEENFVPCSSHIPIQERWDVVVEDTPDAPILLYEIS
jgi:hypothetical protein